jgi:MacB-like periplasmic core domain
VSPAEYWELTEINRSFSVVGAFVTGEVNLSARDRPRRVTRATVNAELLEALAVQPEHGRWFRREETRAGGPALVMLSYDLWQTGFGAREDMMGRTIEVDGVMQEVIGIMPAGSTSWTAMSSCGSRFSSLLRSADFARVTFSRSWDV